MRRLELAATLLFVSCLALVPPGQAQVICPPRLPHCAPPPYLVPASPVWATFNAVAGGNYPGGSQEFTVFIVNSDSPPLGNTTVQSEVLTTPFQNVTLTGLPVELARGQSLSSNVTVQIPRNFDRNNFTAYVLIHVSVANSTLASAPTELTGTAQVFMLGSPIGAPSSTTSASQQSTHLSGPQPVWATLNALAYGNYPGGNEQFTAFVANSNSPALGNVSLINETLTAPALPPPNNSNGATGLPVLLSPGQAIASSIYLPIPSDFASGSFVATLVVNLQIDNATGFFSKQLTLTTSVVTMNLPGVITTSNITTTTHSSVSSGPIYLGVASVGVVVIVIVVALLARRRSHP
jgi:hypothetical protein